MKHFVFEVDISRIYKYCPDSFYLVYVVGLQTWTISLSLTSPQCSLQTTLFNRSHFPPLLSLISFVFFSCCDEGHKICIDKKRMKWLYLIYYEFS